MDLLPKSVDELSIIQIAFGAVGGLCIGMGGSMIMNYFASSQIRPVEQPDPTAAAANPKKWDALPELLAKLTSNEGAEQLYSAIVTTVREEMDADFSALLLHKDGEYVHIASDGLSDESQSVFKLPDTEGIIRYIEERNCAIHIEKGDRQLSVFRFLREPVNEAIMLPLHTGKTILAILFVANKSQFGTFQKADLDTATFLSVPFSIVVSDASSFKKNEDAVRENFVEICKHFENSFPYMIGHAERVARFIAVLGPELKLSEEELDNLRLAALLQNLGKLAIPSEYAFSPNIPAEGEVKDLIFNQTKRAVALLKPFPFFKEILPIIYSCHEHYDGSGFPNGYRGSTIPLSAMALAVVNAFDMLTHDLPGRPKISPTEAAKVLNQEAGKVFDPQVVRAFLQALEKISSKQVAPKDAKTKK